MLRVSEMNQDQARIYLGQNARGTVRKSHHNLRHCFIGPECFESSGRVRYRA